MKLTHSLLALAVGSALAVAPAFATSVTGQANFTGSATVSLAGIMFSSSNGANTFSPQSVSTGSFSGLSGGTIQDLTGPPTTGPVSITDFMTFTTSGGTVNFDLQNVMAGAGTAGGCASDAVGSVCTPPSSPFTLTQTTADTVSISLVLNGIAYTGTSASGSSMGEAIYTTQVVPGTITDILAAVATTGITESYSATLSTTAPAAVPEPASLLLMGFGLLGAALIGRRKVRN